MAMLSLLTDSYFHPPATPLDKISDFFTILTLALIVLFTVSYGLFFRFWKRPAGIAIESVFLSLSIYIGYAAMTRLWTGGDYPGRDLLRLLVWILIPASLTFLFVVLVIAWFRSGSPIKAITDVPLREHPATPQESTHAAGDSVEA